MAIYGLTSAGFIPKTIEILTAEINDAIRAAFGASINVTTGVLARIVAIFVERLAELWELAEEVNASGDPDAARAARLEALCALTGTLRRPATYSAVLLTLTGTPTVVVPTGARARTASTLAEFATTLDATITALDAWTSATGCTLGDLVTNNARAYVCTIAGASAGSGGPTTTATAIVDGTVTWRYLGDGTGAADVLAAATVVGPTTAVSGDIVERVTPYLGWAGVVNQLDATLGSLVETDEALRVRRAQEVAAPGSSPAPAILAALLEVGKGTANAVTNATVFYNNTDTTDGDGIPPHSIEALVQGGEDADVFACLFANVALGIGYAGTESGVVVDSQGTSNTIKFSRPVLVPIYVQVTLEKDPAFYALDGDAQVENAIVAWGDQRKTGANAVASLIAAQPIKAGVAGINDVSEVLISTSPTPTLATTIQIGLRELATYDTSRINVITTDGVA